LHPDLSFRTDFEVEPTTNRLLAVGDSALTGSNLNQRKMRYDNAGNLVNDSWTSNGSSSPGVATRTYDAENRMTSALDQSGGTTNYGRALGSGFAILRFFHHRGLPDWALPEK
jgi:hypothetical protein